MLIRPYRHEDEGRVTDFLRACGQRVEDAHPEHPLHVYSLLAVDDGRLVAIGSARAVLEGSVVLDPAWGHDSREGPRERLDAVTSLLTTSALIGSSKGFERAYVFTDSYRFARRLNELPGAHDRGRFHVGYRLAELGGGG